MTDLYIDPDTDDIYVGALGENRLTSTLYEEVAQRLRTKLRFFLGEWVLNILAGLPFYRDIFVKNPNLTTIRGAVAAAISADPGVANLDQISLTLDAARLLTLTFSATLTDGSVLSSAGALA